MKQLIIATLFALAPVSAQANDMMIYINVNRLCAAIVNIPYASDNFTDQEWQQFQDCVKYVRQFNGVE
jgi:hypothetical protein